jgi:hypothetical protein
MATRPSKDKRQRQNRQVRQARQAKSVRAGEATAIARGEKEPSSPIVGDGKPGRGSTSSKGGDGKAAGRGKRKSPFAIPGQRAVVMAFLFALVSAGTLLLAPVQVQREVDEDAAVLEEIDEDDISERDEEAGTVTYVEDAKLLDEEGPAVAAGVLLTPILITGVAVWFTKKPQRTNVWTVALIALAAFVFFFAGPYGIITLPSMIALAVGGFQSRRAETKERMAEIKAKKAAGGDGEVIDVDATEAPTGEPVAEDDRR